MIIEATGRKKIAEKGDALNISVLVVSLANIDVAIAVVLHAIINEIATRTRTFIFTLLCHRRLHSILAYYHNSRYDDHRLNYIYHCLE